MKHTQSRLSTIQRNLLTVLRKYPEGVTMAQIRADLGSAGTQEQLARRLRTLYPLYEIQRFHKGTLYYYRLVGKRPSPTADEDAVSNRQRAKCLTDYGSMCQMCGRSPARDKVRLHIDHRIPRSWGGRTVDENLWPLCSDCNEGKKNYYASFNTKLMKTVLAHDSVHRRIAELLHLRQAKWVESDLIKFVANFNDYQEDWHKRLRELRYLGLKIETSRHKAGNRVTSRYRLLNWRDLPADPTKAAREYERKRAEANRRKSSPA